MDNNIDILDELNKGCCMGMDALKYILENVKEESFKNILEKQLIEYQDISSKIHGLYKQYTTDDLQETTLMEKAMTWYGIKKDTIMDDSVSNIAEMLVKGTEMGILEGKKIINHKTMDKKVEKICREYIKMQEAYLKRLKEFL